MTKSKHFGNSRAVYAVLALAIVLALAVVVVVLAAQPAQGQTYSVLYSFRGRHGANPVADLIRQTEASMAPPSTAEPTAMEWCSS